MKALAGKAFPVLPFVFLAVPRLLHTEGELRLLDLGDFRLENGQMIRECSMGYRNFGTLNRVRSNVILSPTWFGGTSQGPLIEIATSQAFHHYLEGPEK